MVLNVLFCAGAVPLRLEERQQHDHNLRPQPDSAEYVQFLEQLVGELSHVFSQWVHQNPISPSTSSPSSTDSDTMNATTRNRNYNRNISRGGISPLPDVIPNAEKKCSVVPCGGQQLRARRGLAPMRCRLDSVGSQASTASSSASNSPSPMNFDLLTPTPTFFCDDDDLSFYQFDVDDVSGCPPSPLQTSPLQTSPLQTPLPSMDVDEPDAVDASSLHWRHVGRDLRGIADQFAYNRRSNTVQESSLSWTLLSALSPLTSPLVSALAVYLWWKMLKR